MRKLKQQRLKSKITLIHRTARAIKSRVYKRPESVLVVVHTATKALLIKRADHASFWQSVTGSLEWGEQAHPAAVRELGEETDIHVPALRQTGITRSYEILPEWQARYAPNTLRNKEHVYYCSLAEQPQIVLNPEEHSEHLWLDFDAAAEKVFSWSNKLAILALK